MYAHRSDGKAVEFTVSPLDFAHMVPADILAPEHLRANGTRRPTSAARRLPASTFNLTQTRPNALFHLTTWAAISARTQAPDSPTADGPRDESRGPILQ
jgi:hypothetical protein